MPLFEYHCQTCEHEAEILVRGQEKPACPACGSDQLEKLLSVPAAHTTGSKSAGSSLPMMGGGCGLPQCGQGRCAGME